MAFLTKSLKICEAPLVKRSAIQSPVNTTQNNPVAQNTSTVSSKGGAGGVSGYDKKSTAFTANNSQC